LFVSGDEFDWVGAGLTCEVLTVLVGSTEAGIVLVVRIAGLDAVSSVRDMAAGPEIMYESAIVSSTNTPLLSQTANMIVRTRTINASVAPMAKGTSSIVAGYFEGMRPSGGASHAVGSGMADEDAMGKGTDIVECENVSLEAKD
jgi:hypothetical protein